MFLIPLTVRQGVAWARSQCIARMSWTRPRPYEGKRGSASEGAEACNLEWLCFEEVSDPPRTTDHRISGQRCAEAGDGTVDSPLPIFDGERRCDMRPVGLQMSFELQAKHPQRGMPRQHRIELADGNLGRPRWQARKGIIGGRQLARRFDKREMAQSGARRGLHVEQLRQRADRHRHGAGPWGFELRWLCSRPGQFERTFSSPGRRRRHAFGASTVGRPPSPTRRQTGPPGCLCGDDRHRHRVGCGVHVMGQ